MTNSRYSHPRFASLSFGLAACTALTAGAAYAQDSGRETVIVTAQKREQSLQEVPIAVTALDDAFIESRGVTSIESLTALSPGLTIQRAPNNKTAAQISIRGGVTINPALTWEPTVGIYRDGVYIGKTQGSIFDVVDLERVEVLRGPQGSLYGRNTLAGAINLVTKKPTGEFGGSAEISYGNYDYKMAKATVDLPQAGPFKIKAAGMIEERDGLVDVVDNPFPAVTTAGARSTDELDNIDRKAALVSVQFDPTDQLTVDYSFDYSDADQKPQFAQIIRVLPGNIFDPASPFYAGGLVGGQYFGFPLDLYVNAERQDTASIDFETFERSTVQGHALTATYDLGGAEIKSITGYRELEWEDSLDLDGSPLPLAHTERYSDYESFSQEVQITGEARGVNYVGGVYYFSDEGNTENPQFFFGGASVFDSQYNFETEAWAAYGQVDVPLGERVTLTGGLRYTTEDKSIGRRLISLSPTPVTFVPGGTSAEETFDRLTPTVILAYQANPDVNLYVKYAEGYKSGGFNGEASTPAELQRPYDEETIQSIEAGLKSVLLGGDLTLNTAVFYNQHQDMQLSVFTAQNAASSDIRNAGEANMFGFEIEATARPSDRITVTANYAYLDPEYDEFIDAGVDVADDRAFPHAPEHTLSLIGDVNIADGPRGRLDASADLQYVSEYFTYPYTLDRTQPQNAFGSQADARGVLNARLAWSEIPVGQSDTKLEVSVWGRNITDEEYLANFIDFGAGFGGLTNGYFGDPRTYGVTLRAKW